MGRFALAMSVTCVRCTDAGGRTDERGEGR